MAAICFPYEKRLRRASWALMSSTNSSRSDPFSSLSSFSVRRLVLGVWAIIGDLTNHIVAILVAYERLRRTFAFVVDCC